METRPRADAQPVRIGAAAGNRTRTRREDILLLNHRREIKRAGSVLTLPAHAISTKNNHLLVIYSIPARGFTAALSVFRGTPPPKPLNCKSVSNQLGARLRSRWAEPTGGCFRTGHQAFLRLNSFGTVRHHRDVALLSFTDCSPFVASIHR